MVVVCSNRDADHQLTTAFFARVAANVDQCRRHHYLLLSTNPATMPLALQASLAQLGTAVLPKPFDVDALLTGVREAAEQLTMRQHQTGVLPMVSLPENAS